MSDAPKGGRYFGPARFFLAGDKVLAQRHISEARMLFGYMRDQHAMGGPVYQAQYTELQDGTRIKAIMNNGLFQAEVISPAGVRAEIAAIDLVFIFDVVESDRHVIYRIAKKEFVVIEPLVFGAVPNQTEYTTLRNYWYGGGKGRNATVAVAGADHQYVAGPFYQLLHAGYASAWAAAENDAHQSRVFGVPPSGIKVRACSVWGSSIVHLLSTGSSGYLRLYSYDNVTLPTPTGGMYNIGSLHHPGMFNPDGDTAIVIKNTGENASGLGAYVLAKIHPENNITYQEVSVAVTVPVSQSYYSDGGTTTYTQNTYYNECDPRVSEWTVTYAVTPEIVKTERILAAGFLDDGTPAVLTELYEVDTTGTTSRDEYHYWERQSTGMATYTTGAPPAWLVTDNTQYIEDRNATYSAAEKVSTTRYTYKLNGVVVYTATRTITDTSPAGATTYHSVSRVIGDGLSCEGSRIPYSGPEIDPPTVAESETSTSTLVPTTTTKSGHIPTVIFQDLRVPLLVVSTAGANGGYGAVVVTPNDQVALPLRGGVEAAPPSSLTLFAYGAVYDDLALIHICNTYYEYDGWASYGLFLVSINDDLTLAVEDVTDQIPNGWTPYRVTLCADKDLTEV